jgi:hypothetical protein
MSLTVPILLPLPLPSPDPPDPPPPPSRDPPLLCLASPFVLSLSEVYI